ncbi:MAG: VOC family protein [Verrucomicrobia bacterium]|nr:VOC family protein [Verrucomicrobiota bacterium]MDA1065937.1 VOC family protein [Verrucomicrobiota bacterium]
MISINQLNHTAIHVADVERSVAFYRDVLQLKEIGRPNFNFAGAWFQIGPDQELHLICKEGGSYTVPLERHTAYRVPDMAQAKAHLDSLGITYEGPRFRPDGPLQLFLNDPDGHVVELTQLDV